MPLEAVAIDGKHIQTLGRGLAAFSRGSFSYLTEQSTMAALLSAMHEQLGNGPQTWCQICPVLALHSTVYNTPDGTRAKRDLFRLCNGGDSFIHGFLGSAPNDPVNLRIDGQSCQLCPDNTFPDSNQVCNQDCPADVTIDGAIASVPFQQTFSTSQSSGPSDSCPDIFVVEVDHPDQFSAHQAVSLSANVTVDVPSDATCDRTFSETLADLPTGSSSFKDEQTQTFTGALAQSQLSQFGPCGRLPAFTLAPTDLHFGSAPIRFVTHVLPGTSILVTAPLPPIIPR